MRRHTSSTIATLMLLFVTFGCGGDNGAGPGGGGNTGMLLGQVRSPHASGDEAVVGAVVSVEGGPSAVTDASGSFRINGVPASDNVVVKIAGPQSKDPDHPLTHSTQEIITSLSKGEEVQIFATLVIGCRRTFDMGTGATIDISPCGAGGEVTLTFAPGDLALANGTPFTGTVLADIAVLDPNVAGQVAAFTQGDEGNPGFGELFGGIEVRPAPAPRPMPRRSSMSTAAPAATAPRSSR